MATVNGDSAPPATTTELSDTAAHDNKRKREDESAITGKAGISEARIKQIQLDILQVLQSHDTTPSFLRHALTKAPSDEPSPKKAKLASPSSDGSTIQNNLATTEYSSLQQLKIDASHVSEDIATSIRTKARERESGRPTADELKQIHRIRAFETLLIDIVDRELSYIEPKGAEIVKPKKEDSGLTNGHAPDSNPSTGSGHARTVLTLFGNAPTPKQLFSSMQNAQDVSEKPFIKSELPVDETPLPVGLTATKVMSAPADDSKKGPTFEQAFAPPYSLATLQPPKTHKRSSTRDNSVTWEFKDPIQRNRKGGYTVQPLTVGTWLGYGGLDGEEPVSPREKRKQRDRALSTSGETAEKPAKELSVEALKRQEEALFRRAYSSFAPSRDDANAVVPEEVKDMVWWQKVGNKRFNEVFAIDPALLDESSEPAPPMESILDGFREEEFSKVIEDLDELEKTSVDEHPELDKDKTDVEQVLREISELLETLASHQRIRNAALPASSTTARTPISPGPLAAAKIGKPDEPSEDELSTYHTLQRELAYLILKLPPYAVAKLDGDQLSDLGVSKLLTFQSRDIKGTLEEDQVTRNIKAAAQATANSIANLARPNSSAGQHYSSTAQRTPAIGQAANTRYGQQYVQRTPAPAPSFQRQPSNPQSYGTPTGAQRPSYLQNYTRPGAAPPSYNQPTQQYHQARPPQQTPGGYNYGQQYQQSQMQQRPGYPAQTPHQYQQYQQRSQTAAANAVAYQTNTPGPQQYYQNRTASPSKPGYPTPMQPNQQAVAQRPIAQAPIQPQQPGSGRATPVSYPSQPQTPVNGFAPPPRQPQSGIAPRPSSSTPQPGPFQPPPGPAHQGAALQANGTALDDTPNETSSFPPTNLTGINLVCDKCGKIFKYREWFKKHTASCQV